VSDPHSGFPCDTCKYYNEDEGCLMDFGSCPAIWDGTDPEKTADRADRIVAYTQEVFT